MNAPDRRRERCALASSALLPSSTTAASDSAEPAGCRQPRFLHTQQGGTHPEQQSILDAADTTPAWLRSPKLHLRLPSRPGVVLVVAMRRVTHIPLDTKDPRTLTLCPALDLDDIADWCGASCPDGTACSYVHADVRRAAEYRPHELAQSAALPRFTAADLYGSSSAVLAPTSTIAVLRQPPPPPGRRSRVGPAPAPTLELVAIGDLLRTRIFDNDADNDADKAGASDLHQPPVLCVHFERKGRCDRGDACNYVHHAPLVEHDAPLVTFVAPPPREPGGAFHRRGVLACRECAAVATAPVVSHHSAGRVHDDRLSGCRAAHLAVIDSETAPPTNSVPAPTNPRPPPRQHRPYQAARLSIATASCCQKDEDASHLPDTP